MPSRAAELTSCAAASDGRNSSHRGQGAQVSRSAALDDVRTCDPREGFANQGSSGREGIFRDYFYQLFYSYRPNQIYQDPVFFLLFRARQ